ncbi:ABC transporter ATP-binding protein [Paenibacillus methanolicus]|uniref:ABC-type nitrate/sulfonate/bicarbonate transport system ATPase subunit n=1 Tax=Paenibacillus methanolicus TaxID=582686 RepID=A0A5S5CH93_9BACL|nr:ABC transporter ATP-binding protein [Paenibacillus methanolicus]TYP77710.1 ABC-type nitrate/sulfonate/bicarbonate transport system ATPase subunit [Paenibacillus methanolicus]
MTDFALEITGIGKTFSEGRGAKRVLGDVSFHVKEGEFVSIIGPSGSGKSTLFHLIGGLERPTSGEIRMDGRLVTGERGRIAYMPQSASLLPWLTVRANIVMALTIAGLDRHEAESQTSEWLARVGLAGEADAYPDTLSGGMQQRVSFLRALLSPQRLMCLDEPFGALDALTRLHMQTWLLSLWEADRRSVLFVTHSIEEALLLSDRILVLSPSPACVAREIEVPFARPRSESLWTDPLFNELKLEIYDMLKPTDGRSPLTGKR